MQQCFDAWVPLHNCATKMHTRLRKHASDTINIPSNGFTPIHRATGGDDVARKTAMHQQASKHGSNEKLFCWCTVPLKIQNVHGEFKCKTLSLPTMLFTFHCFQCQTPDQCWTLMCFRCCCCTKSMNTSWRLTCGLNSCVT